MFAKRLFGILLLLALTSNAALSATPSAKANAAEGQAFTLVSLKHETTGALTRILIESSAPPLYTVYRPSERMVVVDLPGGDSSHLAPQYAVKNALVDSIAVHQMRPGPSGRSMTRIEIATRDDVRDRSMVNGNTLVLELALSSPAKDAKHAPEKPAAASGVYVYPTPVVKHEAASPEPKPVASRTAPEPKPERAAPKPVASKPATLVRDVRSETDGGVVRIVVDANGAVQFKAFVLPDPWRIVVDITGVRSSLNNKTTNVGAAAVERMRVGQPSPNTVRIVLDAKSKVNYRVERDGESLVITVGDSNSSRRESATPEVKAQKPSDVKPTAPPSNVAANHTTVAPKENPTANTVAQPSVKEVVKTSVPSASPASAPDESSVKTTPQPEVKVAGQRIENKPESGIPANLMAQSNRPPPVTPQPNRALPLPSQPATNSAGSGKETIGNSGSPPAYSRSVLDAPRGQQPNAAGATARPQSKARAEMAFCDSSYVGGLISLDLRAGVDLRDMLRFISQQYGVNFIIDKSVGAVPVDIRVTDIPWNQVMESVLRANRLGAVCESNGRMIRVATLTAVKEEEDLRAALAKQQAEQIPLVTKIVHLKYARAVGALGAGGGGRSGSGGGSSSGSSSSGAASGNAGGGSLVSIITTRLTPRGRIEMDGRTNSLIITDLPEIMPVIEDMIAWLDRPEPQVEIEARIVIASRNFLRDLGVELAGAVIGKHGKTGILETSPVQFSGGGLAAGGQGSSSSGSGSGSGSSSGSKGLGPNLIGPFADTALRAGVPNTVFGLTTGVIGTGIISSTLSAQETKGQIRTIASPRITTTDGKTAEIVNGVQIPVQTVSNNTVTTTFVTAALRMEITPQIVEETGEVQMHIVAENNTVNFALAGQFNNGTPGINTQSAESTVLIQDGGTTVLGGINVDTEGHTINRTPGVSRIPLLGELFKRRTTRRDTDEILFFITPRIVRNDGMVGPRVPQRSSLEGTPNPAGTQRATAPPAPAPVNKGGQ